MANIFTSIASWFTSTKTIVEADVQKIVAAIITGEQVAVADIAKVNAFLIQELPTVVADLAAVSSFAQAVAPAVPQVAVINGALQTANAIVAGLQDYAGKVGAGTPGELASAAVSGYHTYTSAQAANASVAAKATAPTS